MQVKQHISNNELRSNASVELQIAFFWEVDINCCKNLKLEKGKGLYKCVFI